MVRRLGLADALLVDEAVVNKPQRPKSAESSHPAHGPQPPPQTHQHAIQPLPYGKAELPYIQSLWLSLLREEDTRGEQAAWSVRCVGLPSPGVMYRQQPARQAGMHA